MNARKKNCKTEEQSYFLLCPALVPDAVHKNYCLRDGIFLILFRSMLCLSCYIFSFLFFFLYRYFPFLSFYIDRYFPFNSMDKSIANGTFWYVYIVLDFTIKREEKWKKNITLLASVTSDHFKIEWSWIFLENIF
jgi:hypothetical protein